MVLAFVALVALANGMLGGSRRLVRHGRTSPSSALLGHLFAPVMYLLGIPWDEAQARGRPVRHQDRAQRIRRLHRSRRRWTLPHCRTAAGAIVTFSLCGFANFSSIAIQMAVTGGLAPNQRPVIARLGLRALAAGSLANLMSAALAGLFLPV